MLLPCLLTCIQVASAQLVFADRYDQAFAEATARNVPVLVVDFDGWTTDQKQGQWTAFYEDTEFLAQAETTVLVLASQEQHAEKKQVVDGVERSVCATFGSIPCTAHRDMLPKVFADFGRNGELRSPLFVIATPDHKEVARLEHEQPPLSVIPLLKQAQRKLGAGLKRSDFLRLERGAKQLAQLIASRDYAPAVALCAELRLIPGSFSPQQQLAAFEKQLDDAGRAMVTHATEMWAATRWLDALLEMEEARASFGKLPCAATAAAAMARWEKSGEAKPHLAALKGDRLARSLFQQACDFDRKGEPKRSIPLLERLLSSGPDTRFAARAHTMLLRLKPGQQSLPSPSH